MYSFRQFSLMCQHDDGKIHNFSLCDLANAFKEARATMCDEEFEQWLTCMWNAINRVRSGYNKKALQKVVNHLEVEKITLLGLYVDTNDEDLAYKHNELEHDIRFLCGQFELDRFTKCEFITIR